MAILTTSGRTAIAKAIVAQPLHLAWGTGDPAWDTNSVPAEQLDEVALVQEVGRRTATSVEYVVPDDAGDVVVPVFSDPAPNQVNLPPDRRRFRVVNEPTPNLFMRFNFDYDEAPASVIRELAVFVGSVPVEGLPAGQRYFTLSELADRGHMLAMEKLRERIIRSANGRQSFEFVLTI